MDHLGCIKQGDDVVVPFHFDRLPGEPGYDDVVLGRGMANAWRPGNARFLRAVDGNIVRYVTSRTNKEKGNIIHDLFTSVLLAKGRFLCETKDRTFQEMGEVEAKVKISHCLRYRRNKLLSIREGTGSANYCKTRSLHGGGGPSETCHPAREKKKNNTSPRPRSLTSSVRVTPMPCPFSTFPGTVHR